MNAITRAEASALPAIQMDDSELIHVLQNSLYPGAALSSIKLVVSYCKASAMDPMQKPVHIVPMWDSEAKQMRDVIMPGIGLYRTQAARNGCAGITEPEFGPDVTEEIGGVRITYPAWARVTVKRVIASGQVVDFTAKEFWKENYAVKGGQAKSIAPNAMWTKRPYGQIAKCAEAQALRKAFPEIGSAPTADEMEGKSLNDFAETVDASTGEITQTQAPTKAVWPDESFNAQIERWGKAVASGLKTAAEIESIARTKGDLTQDQLARIKALKTVDAVDAQPAEEQQ